MRLENGMRFDHCIGLQDGDSLDGKIFDANMFTCHDKPLSSGENIRVGGRAYRYDGDDNLGNSHFTALEPFPEFERVERVGPHPVAGGETQSDDAWNRHTGNSGDLDVRETFQA